MGPDVERTRSIGSRGRRIGAGLIGEALEPSCMRGIRTPSMCEPVRRTLPSARFTQVEPRRTRGKGEISDADKVPVRDEVVMSLQSIERTPKQTGSDLAVDSFLFVRKRGSAGRPRSKAGKSKSDKKRRESTKTLNSSAGKTFTQTSSSGEVHMSCHAASDSFVLPVAERYDCGSAGSSAS